MANQDPNVFADDYRVLIEDARDAVRALLEASTPESWIGLRGNYGRLLEHLADDDRNRERIAERAAAAELVAMSAEKQLRRQNEQHAAQVAWQSLSRERREAAVLDVLGDEQLTRTEIAKRLDAKLRTPECGRWGVVYVSYVRPVLERMVNARQLERETELFKNKPRHRYSRRRGLDGPIADLERRFHETGEA
jgi:hypothetical protein